ncbi:hypothetical protein TNCV_2603161 [Trichonephila clavipes]|nr:hypothetical protein TNCV_2603161 [Trichonephila clavipes]
MSVNVIHCNVRLHISHLLFVFLESEDNLQINWPNRSLERLPVEPACDDALESATSTRITRTRTIQVLKRGLLNKWD